MYEKADLCLVLPCRIEPPIATPDKRVSHNGACIFVTSFGTDFYSTPNAVQVILNGRVICLRCDIVAELTGECGAQVMISNIY